MNEFDEKLEKFVKLSNELTELVNEGHALLKDMKIERKEIEKLVSTEVKDMIHNRVDEVVKKELDEIGPTIRKQTSLIYDKVGLEIDKLINICLGKELSTKPGSEDLRPILAAKLHEWLQEIVNEEYK